MRLRTETENDSDWNYQVRLGLLEGADNPAKQPIGLVANHLHDEQQG